MIPSPIFSRRAPTTPLPPYSYVPGHDHPHPITDPNGHSFNARHKEAPFDFPTDPTSRHHALAAFLATCSPWLYALDLFNAGFYWEAHEAWEHFWNALGRTTPEARCVQGLIHLAAAAVKIREGKPAGVSRHTQRARELLGDCGAANVGGACETVAAHEPNPNDVITALGLSRESVAAVVVELAACKPACWHTSRVSVVRVLAGELRMAG
jgi:hypothetical protein